MKTILLTIGMMLTALSGHAMPADTIYVMRNDGVMVPAPTFGSAESELITPRKHPDNLQVIPTRAIDTSQRYTPHTGRPHILVILANFKDVKFQVHEPKAAFHDFFNAEGPIVNRGNGNNENFGSVSQYFKATSLGAFEPVFEVYGPIDLPKDMTYYGGSNANNNSDEKPRELVQDAVNCVKDQVTNIDRLDSNNDGYIDCVYVVYAGLGQNNGGSAESVWACTSVINNPSLKIGNKNVYNFSIGAELFPSRIRNQANGQERAMQINSIGVTCHEFSHAMGLPDIYPTISSAYLDNQEMEYWDLMDGGEYAGNGGFIPMPYTAWEKKQMNWPVNIQPLTSKGNITMDKSADDGGIVYKIVNPGDPNEYFLLEYITKTGWYAGASNQGLLVYKVVDQGNVNMSDHPNNTPNRPRMAVVPADGLCMSSYSIQVHEPTEPNYKELNRLEKRKYKNQLKGDVFPGTVNADNLNDNSNLPNFWWYTKGELNERATLNPSYYKVNQSLKNIKLNANGAISFTFYPKYNSLDGINKIQIENSEDHHIFTLDGKYVGNQLENLSKGVYIRNHKKVIVK